MKRKIIEINEETCNGCGICAAACHEGAIAMVNGKARLIRDDYCDGLGDCLPACPVGAITFTEREAAAYDKEAVARNKKSPVSSSRSHSDRDVPACGCPGTESHSFHHPAKNGDSHAPFPQECFSELNQWPVQIRLVPAKASYFDNADLLVAADCTAYAYADFHKEFIHNRITLIGCPKLDSEDYSEKLTAILRENDIKSLTVIRMEVPCCGGIEAAARTALQASHRFIPWQVITISTEGQILR